MGLPFWFWKFAYAGWLLGLLACAILLPDVLYFGKFRWFAGFLLSSLFVGLLLEVSLSGDS
jgi:hypothetical protein